MRGHTDTCAACEQLGPSCGASSICPLHRRGGGTGTAWFVCGMVCQLASSGCDPAISSYLCKWLWGTQLLLASSTEQCGMHPTDPSLERQHIAANCIQELYWGLERRELCWGVKPRDSSPTSGLSTSTLSTWCFLLRASSCPTQVGCCCTALGVSETLGHGEGAGRTLFLLTGEGCQAAGEGRQREAPRTPGMSTMPRRPLLKARAAQGILGAENTQH